MENKLTATEKLFEAYGRDMSIEYPTVSMVFRGVLQPLRYKNKIYLSGVSTELGYDKLNKYLLLCSARVPLETVDGKEIILKIDAHGYCVDHCELVYFADEPSYYWAIVHKEDITGE